MYMHVGRWAGDIKYPRKLKSFPGKGATTPRTHFPDEEVLKCLNLTELSSTAIAFYLLDLFLGP